MTKLFNSIFSEKNVSHGYCKRTLFRVSAEPGSKLTRTRRPVKFEPRRETESRVLEVLHKTVKQITPVESLLETFESTKDDSAELELLEGPLPGRFREFNFHNKINVLVAENDSKELNLAQCYLYDEESKIYARPFISPEVPDQYQGFMVQEWDTWVSGDVVYDKEETTELEKVYFIGQLPLKGNQFYPHVDLTNVYCIDSHSRRVERSTVVDLRDEKTVDPILRIKEDGIVIMDSRDCPTREHIAHREDIAEYLEHQWQGREELMEFDTRLLEEADDDMEYADEPDLPEADM